MLNQTAILYGLAACDTCRQARRAIESTGRPVTFRDVRDAPLSGDEIRRFLGAFGDRLVNRASATWRGLSEEARQNGAEALIAAHPALMKRPVIVIGEDLWLGWDEKVQGAVIK